MRILVIEDNQYHQNSAIETLAGHDLTIAESFDKANELMAGRNFNYEVVLTDMMMPMSALTIAPELFDPEEQVPYGFVIALKAVLRGAKYVAMVTDLNHHRAAISGALDDIDAAFAYGVVTPNFEINGARVMFIHSPFTPERCKDWGKVLDDLLREKE